MVDADDESANSSVGECVVEVRADSICRSHIQIRIYLRLKSKQK